MYQVTDWEQDVAGKFRYRVLIGDESVMFKFHTFPTDEMVQAEAMRYDTMMQEQAAIRDAIMQEQANAIADQDPNTDA